jgi:hypothetical protein
MNLYPTRIFSIFWRILIIIIYIIRFSLFKVLNYLILIIIT